MVDTDESTYGGTQYGGTIYGGLPAAPSLAEDLRVKEGNTLLEVEDTVKQFKIRDERPIIQDQLLKNGSPADLTGAEVFFKYEKPDGTTEKESAVIVDAQNGKVEYAWGKNEIEQKGLYKGEWNVVYNDGRDATWPNSGYMEWDVDERLVK